jgi:lipopolysaccharide/colanic/teichoic acid biosynthesis glycosyltransferase
MSPVIAVAAFAIKLSSPGPVLYRQVRLGKNGRPFTMYKLRTMFHGAEAMTGAVWSVAGDPRVTTIGRLLRKCHVDELPQLINVLAGQMALVGPRPERPEIACDLESKIPNYADRLGVRPGITGLAQLHLPPDTDVKGVRKKLICDRHYIRHINAWTDLRILICTGLLLFGVPLSVSRRALRIDEPLRLRCLRTDRPHALAARRQA